MFYLFFGEDTYRSRQKLRDFLEKFSQNSRRFLCSRIDPDTFERARFEELARGSSLFGESYVVICENLFEHKDIAEFVSENIAICAQSPNVFVFWEENLALEETNLLKKHAERTEEFALLPLSQVRVWLQKEAKSREMVLPRDLEERLVKKCGKDLWLLSSELEKHVLMPETDALVGSKADEVDIFEITDAVSQKNRSCAWLLLQKALLAGFDAEEIFWKIVWQIKNLLIVKNLLPLPEKEIIKKSSLHPYVVKKTLSGVGKFEEEELARYSQELITLYHNSRRGLADFETGIEKFLIKL